MLKYCCIATHEAFVTVLCVLSDPYFCDFELLKGEQKTIKNSQRQSSGNIFLSMF